MEDPPEQEMSAGGESPLEIIDKICEEMKSLLTAAETLLQPDQDNSILEAPEVEEA